MKMKSRIMSFFVGLAWCLSAGNAAGSYDILWNGPNGPTAAATSLNLTMGCDEYESVEFVFDAHSAYSDVTFEAVGNTLPAGTVILGKQRGISNSGLTYQENQHGIAYNAGTLAQEVAFDIQSGEQKSVWLQLNSRLLAPGDHSFDLKVSINNVEQEVIPVTVHVLDAERAPEGEATFRMYGTLSYLQNNGWLSDHAEIMTSHYTHQVSLYFPFNYWKNTVVITRNGLGEMQINWTGFDSKLVLAINAGLKKVAITIAAGRPDSWYRDDWFDDPSVDPSNADDVSEFGYMLAEHLLDLGASGPPDDPDAIWIIALDEALLTDLASPETVADLQALKDLHPAYRTHVTINHYGASEMNTINPVLDIWMMADRTCQTLLEDVDSGAVVVDASDEIGFYDQTRFFNSPDDMRALGWRAGYLNVERFTAFSYESSPNNSEWKMYVALDGTPVTTPAFEGLRDGFEDFGYWRKLALLLQEAESIPWEELTSQQQQDLSDAQNFKDEVFNTGSEALVQLETIPGGHGGRAWEDVKSPDRWNFRTVKTQLLNHIISVQNVIDTGPGGGALLWFESFEGHATNWQTNWTTSWNWSHWLAGNASSIGNPPNGTWALLSASTGSFVERPISDSSKPFDVVFYVRVATDTTGSSSDLIDIETASGATLASIQIANSDVGNASAKLNQSGTTITFTKGDDYVKFRLHMDTAAGTVDWYFNDSLVESGIALSTTGNAGLFELRHYGDGAFRSNIDAISIFREPVTTIVGGSVISGTLIKLIIDTPSGLESNYYPVIRESLMTGTWARVEHSDHPDTGFAITNLSYSSTDLTGTNKVIYVPIISDTGFYNIGTQ